MPQLQKCQIVTKVPLSGYISAPLLQKFPMNVTKVPYQCYESSRSYESTLFLLQKCPFLWPERERERERGEHSRQEEEQYCSKLNGGARAHHVQHGKLSIPLKVLWKSVSRRSNHNTWKPQTWTNKPIGMIHFGSRATVTGDCFLTARSRRWLTSGLVLSKTRLIIWQVLSQLTG